MLYTRSLIGQNLRGIFRHLFYLLEVTELDGERRLY
jgi:hypothetical protein